MRLSVLTLNPPEMILIAKHFKRRIFYHFWHQTKINCQIENYFLPIPNGFIALPYRQGKIKLDKTVKTFLNSLIFLICFDVKGNFNFFKPNRSERNVFTISSKKDFSSEEYEFPKIFKNQQIEFSVELRYYVYTQVQNMVYFEFHKKNDSKRN